MAEFKLRCRIWVTEFAYWRIRRPFERLRLWFVWKLPRGLVYWCAIRLIANATTGNHGSQIVPELTAMDALKRWEAEHG